MAQENKIQAQIRKECSYIDNRIFRNHVGSAYSPQAVKAAMNLVQDPHTRKTMEGILQRGYQTFGFGKGSSDIIAIQTVTITSDMIGKKVGLFCAIEVKDPDHKTEKGHLQRQTNFINVITSLGGRAGFADSTLEAYDILNGH